MLADPRPLVTAWALRVMARCTPWVEDEVRGLAALVPRGAIAVDAGAALGVYTRVLARLVGPSGTVVSVEPLPALYARAGALLGLRRGRNVMRYDVALGATTRMTAISVPLRHGRPVAGRSFVTSGASGLGSNAEFAAHVERAVPVLTLDRLVERAGLPRVDFVKADVEGHECALLTGGRATVEQFRPDVLVEVEQRHLARYGHTVGDVVRWFDRRGYAMSAWSEGAWRPVDEVRAEVRNYLFRCPARVERTRRAGFADPDPRWLVSGPVGGPAGDPAGDPVGDGAPR